MSGKNKDLNKRDARKLESLRRQLRELQQRLAGAKKQPDDPREITQLEREIAEVQKHIQQITEGKNPG